MSKSFVLRHNAKLIGGHADARIVRVDTNADTLAVPSVEEWPIMPMSEEILAAPTIQVVHYTRTANGNFRAIDAAMGETPNKT
jgi:hypothetical protein